MTTNDENRVFTINVRTTFAEAPLQGKLLSDTITIGEALYARIYDNKFESALEFWSAVKADTEARDGMG
jgi:hypothetical protein